MMTSASRSLHPRGAALIAVIWLIGVMALACMVTLRVVSFDLNIASAKVHGFDAEQFAEMGVAIASNSAVKRTDPLLKFTTEEGEGYEVRMISEGGRFNINALILKEDRALLREIFTDWGLELDEAQAVTDALCDWVDADDEVALNGAERDWYLDHGRINQPFNRPFYSLDEVTWVRGMDRVEAVKPDWRTWFTIWSSGALDLNEAPADLIAAAAEVNLPQGQQIVDQVRGPDGIRDTDDDMPFQDLQSALTMLGVDPATRPDVAQRFTINDSTVRIESTGTAAGSKLKISMVLRNRTGRPTILERSEEVIP
jgi:general secretion pathway protein K